MLFWEEKQNDNINIESYHDLIAVSDIVEKRVKLNNRLFHRKILIVFAANIELSNC